MAEGQGEISFPTLCGERKEGAGLLRTEDLPEGFANAPQVQSLYSLSSLRKCIDFTGPLVLAHQICRASFLSRLHRNKGIVTFNAPIQLSFLVCRS